MLDIGLAHPTDLDGWRQQARGLIARQIAPDAIAWRVSGHPQDLFAIPSALAPVDAVELTVPRRFAELASTIVCHRHPARFSLLYRLLWRITRGERRLLAVLSDPEVVRAEAMAKSVRRDLHKMKAFVRFRSTEEEGVEHFIAWFEPQHFIVERAAPFFAQRFAGTPWSILTPDRSAHWDGERLSFDPGTDKSEVPSEDALADVWRRYYASIFNPARLNLKAMKAQMPVKYWKNLPEAGLIAPLAAGAGRRTQVMLASVAEQSRRAAPAIPDERSHNRHAICNTLTIKRKNGED
jgi:DNA polymerase